MLPLHPFLYWSPTYLLCSGACAPRLSLRGFGSTVPMGLAGPDYRRVSGMWLTGVSVGEGCAEVVDDSCDSCVTCVTPPVTGVMGLGLHKGGPEVPIRGARNGARPTDLPQKRGETGEEGRGGAGGSNCLCRARECLCMARITGWHSVDYYLCMASMWFPLPSPRTRVPCVTHSPIPRTHTPRGIPRIP